MCAARFKCASEINLSVAHLRWLLACFCIDEPYILQEWGIEDNATLTVATFALSHTEPGGVPMSSHFLDLLSLLI